VIDSLLTALEASNFAATIRRSVYLYPAANVIHVLSAMTFFAVVAAMDFRVLTRRAIDDIRPFINRLRPFAAVAFLVQLLTGVMLLAPEATHLGHNPVFATKVFLILIGLANVGFLEAVLWRPETPKLPSVARVFATASVALWLGVAAAGRMIVYF
jgi:hypothetical protein